MTQVLGEGLTCPVRFERLSTGKLCYGEVCVQQRLLALPPHVVLVLALHLGAYASLFLPLALLCAHGREVLGQGPEEKPTGVGRVVVGHG